MSAPPTGPPSTNARWEAIRREPFRILFPLGALLAWAAVLPWVLFGTGVIRAWLGVYHALTMTEGFLVAVAVGFLGTMFPRRTGAAPMSTAELAVAIAGLLAVPVSLIADRVVIAQAGYFVTLATLVAFVLRRVRRAGRPPHPSFVFMPLGLVLGMAGAALIAASALGGFASLLAPGRSLVEEGLLLSLVLAMAPMLASIIGHGRPLADPGERAYRRQRAIHLGAGALIAASFALQHAVSERAGLLLRGGVAAAELVLASRILTFPTVPGLHRRIFWLALGCVPLGLIAAGAQPAYRVPWLHLTFVGGFSLLVFAVSFHVTFLHTGRDELAARRPWPVAVIGALVVLAALARTSAERFTQHYFEALALASSLWLAGALLWGLFLARLIFGRSPARGSPANAK
jgi:uncharacterized protein involved in response to NO